MVSTNGVTLRPVIWQRNYKWSFGASKNKLLRECNRGSPRVGHDTFYIKRNIGTWNGNYYIMIYDHQNPILHLGPFKRLPNLWLPGRSRRFFSSRRPNTYVPSSKTLSCTLNVCNPGLGPEYPFIRAIFHGLGTQTLNPKPKGTNLKGTKDDSLPS